MFSFSPIGYIQTPFKERFGTPRQPGLVPSAHAKLTLVADSRWQGACDGLEGFSHIWLIFVFHANANKAVRAKIHPPRLDGEKMGMFATRTPHRPNPIGLSVVKLEKVEQNTIYLSGVDLVDGTPILDIKPYVPQVDALPSATGGWTDGKKLRALRVEVSSAASIDAQKHCGEKANAFLQMAREVLELDPRPGFYKGSDAEPNPYTSVYGFRLENLNVTFTVDGDVARIESVQLFSSERLYTRF